jgi:adenylate kinase family enzyme
MPNYQNAKIYKLWSPEGDDIYIGSTTQSLCERKTKHNDNYKRNLTCKSRILFEKYTDVRIELLESCPCDNKEELTKKEGEYIRNNKCVNKYVAGRTDAEWREDNKEKIKEYLEENKEYFKEKTKEYYENNKDKINEWRMQKITCECGRTITLGNKAQHEKSKIHINNCN